jgi:multicomponent Na+:H+ antiporter subunit C
LIKTIIGLNIFQTSVFLLYITMGKVTGGTAPILKGSHSGESHGAESHGAESHGAEHGQELHAAAEGHLDSGVEVVSEIYSNPIPSVLMLTAIVVGIATTALALALVVRIREEYGTIEEDEILEMDRNS